MTDNLAARLLGAIEDVEATIGSLSPNLLLNHCAAHRRIVERAEKLRIRASEDPDSLAYQVAWSTAKADLNDLAESYDLNAEPAP